MTELNQYRLSLHVSHPNLAVSDVVPHFTLPIRYSKSVGEERITKSGRSLGGVYSKTDISFDVSGGVLVSKEVPLYDCLLGSIRDLPFDEIREIIQTGGECFYVAGIYAEDNYLLYLQTDILALLSTSFVGLKLDFYGGKDIS